MSALKNGDLVCRWHEDKEGKEPIFGLVCDVLFYDVPAELQEQIGADKQCVPRVKWLHEISFIFGRSKPFRCSHDNLFYVENKNDGFNLHPISFDGKYEIKEKE